MWRNEFTRMKLIAVNITFYVEFEWLITSISMSCKITIFTHLYKSNYIPKAEEREIFTKSNAQLKTPINQKDLIYIAKSYQNPSTWTVMTIVHFTRLTQGEISSELKWKLQESNLNTNVKVSEDYNKKWINILLKMSGLQSLITNRILLNILVTEECFHVEYITAGLCA